MRSDRRPVRWLAFLLVPMAVSCGSTATPRTGGSVRVDDLADLYGADIEAELVTGDATKVVRGEFLSSAHARASDGPDSVFVLTPEGVTAIEIGSIRRARLEMYWLETGTRQRWSVGNDRASIRPTQDLNWEQARRFARFPQGLPSGVDRAALAGAPRRERPVSLYVRTRSGEELHARSVFTSRMGFVDVLTADGATRHFEANDIVRITDAGGKDVTREFLSNAR